ncbi:hypothetical protein PRZ48_002338 [Zasmidium cellare]|uniref:Maleylacetate reductase n=1 Tax=Zasmidium cellare TaxID=395010 RepID=A0ABR0F3R7_ZASCE|nr:hypothetical protein PRZ48_002338 [Zasmidium cellare]
MDAFEYTTNPSRVIFGAGSITKLPFELKRLNLSKPLLLSTPQQKDQITTSLLPILETASLPPAGLYANTTMHTPTSITADALAYLHSRAADSIVSFGGGSTIGLGKALTIRTGLPHLCVPTTYAGSEMTPILGETAEGRKTTRSDPKILPGVVVYDVEFTFGLPVGMSATSGVNAVAHAVEALYAQSANPITSLLALEGIKALAASLPTIVATPNDLAARSLAQYGAYLCATCLGSVGMSLHHKLCHVLGGTFNLPHAETHTIVLPHALAYNVPKLDKGVLEKLAGALPGSEGDAVRGLEVLLGKLGVQRGLREFGMQEGNVDRAVEVAMEKPYWNPRAVEREGLREVIRRCWAGEPARMDL